jgi:hypothetical protein
MALCVNFSRVIPLSSVGLYCRFEITGYDLNKGPQSLYHVNMFKSSPSMNPIRSVTH